MRLWEIKHEYYCEPFCGDHLEYQSWDDFYSEWHDADMDYNLLFRWDWILADGDNEGYTDELRLFWMLQRKGRYLPTIIKIKKEDEDEVRKFIEPRFNYLKQLWEPFI